MFKRNKLLYPCVLVLLGLAVFWGCDQPEDILTPISKTNIWLSPSKLPSNPDGTIYQLWLANSTDSIPVAQFGYDDYLGRFLEANGSARADSNLFTVNYDLFEFSTIFVSVECVPDDNSNSPGAIMLMDATSDQTIKLRFPEIDSLWSSTMWYNMESPSDNPNGFAGDSITDGYGVWLSTYTEMTRALNDTLSILEWTIDTIPVTEYEEGDVMIVAVGIVPGSIITKDTTRVYGLDTFYQTVTRFEVELDTIVEPPYFATNFSIDYEVETGTIVYDNFNQGQEDDEFALPVLSDYGWKYKAWVVSPQIDPNMVTNRITLPAWLVIGDTFDETDGAMLSMGTFADVRFPDEANPFVASARLPRFPGEDFLNNLPGGHPPINLIPNSNGNPGRVFVSLEPYHYDCDTTNFPLIPFVGPLPESRAMVTDGDLTQQFVLRGWMQDTADPFCGFPWILIDYERF